MNVTQSMGAVRYFDYETAQKSRIATEPVATSFENYLREVYSLMPLRPRYGNRGGNVNKFSTGGHEKINSFMLDVNNSDNTKFGFSYTKPGFLNRE